MMALKLSFLTHWKKIVTFLSQHFTSLKDKLYYNIVSKEIIIEKARLGPNLIKLLGAYLGA